MAAPPSDAARAVTPPTAELGVSGTTNFFGDVLAESNASLTYQQAYGQAGSREWGEWEALARTNPFVATGLDFVAGPIRDARVGVMPADETPQAKAIADYVRWNLLEAFEPVFSEFLAQAVRGALGVGFAVFEPVFARCAHPLLPGGQGWRVARTPQRLPATMAVNAWREGADGDLAYVRQSGNAPDGKWVTADIPAERLLLFSWQRAGNNYQGFSAFRPVWYIAKVQAELLRLVGVTYQREGAGVPVMTGGENAGDLTDSQRADAEEFLANLVYHENASAVMPRGWKLDWVFSGGSNKGHILDAWRQLGVVILQQVQAQQLVLGTAATGSRSVGETHDAAAMQYIGGVASFVESVLNGVGSRKYTGLVRRIVDANWGPQAAYPRLTLTLRRSQLGPLERLQAVQAAVASGALTMTGEDENSLREELGLAPIDAAKRDAAKTGRPAAPPPTQAGARLVAAAPRKQWTPWRPLRATEKVLQLEALDEWFASRREAFERLARPVVVEMVTRAAPDIAEAMKDGDPSEVAALPFDSARLGVVVREYLADVRDAGARFVRGELATGDGAELAEERRDALTAAAEDDEAARKARAKAEKILEAQARQLLSRIESRLRSELGAEAIDALRTGDDAEAVARRVVVRQLETGAFKTDAGTVTARIFNTGRDEAAAVVGGVDEVEYSAILDTSTCGPCRGMDGRRAEFQSPEHDAMTPPNRDCEGGGNCRCLLVYLPKGGV